MKTGEWVDTKKDKMVVYVQHDDGLGTDLDRGKDNYEIFDEFAPAEGEKRFEKDVNSSFHAVKSGFEQGFHIIIPAYANSTYDNLYFDRETAYKYYKNLRGD